MAERTLDVYVCSADFIRMHPKFKYRQAGTKVIGALSPPLLYGTVDPTASMRSALGERRVATQPASGRANHARHHTSRHTQS